MKSELVSRMDVFFASISPATRACEDEPLEKREKLAALEIQLHVGADVNSSTFHL